MSTELVNLPALDLPETQAQDWEDEEGGIRAASITLHRDVQDVRLLFSLSFIILVLGAALAASIGLNLYQAVRRTPAVTIREKADGETEVLNGYGRIDNISAAPDQPGDGDKRTLARKFSEALYQIDPRTRSRDVERALKMMVPASALALMEKMKGRRDLERQATESWSTSWTQQVTTIDRDDRMKVKVVGLQEITRLAGGSVEHDARQLTFTLQLVPDPRRRTDDNQNTGYLVADIIDLQEIAKPSQHESEVK